MGTGGSSPLFQLLPFGVMPFGIVPLPPVQRWAAVALFRYRRTAVSTACSRRSAHQRRCNDAD